MQAYERLLAYVKYNTASCEDAEKTPSTPGQHILADALAEEMRALGLSDVYVDEHAYVYGRIPASQGYEDRIPVGFIAHIDTVRVKEGYETRPAVIRAYDGGAVALGGSGLTLSPSDFPHLCELVGQTLIVTDGNTILGADDKAGIAEIMTAAENILLGEIPHGPVCVCFTPDEEIGHGAALLDLDRFGARYAYTVDGSAPNEIEYETFNAAAARWKIHGAEVHPGSAKGFMKNAAAIAAEIVSLLPREETPERTEGYEGFYHLTSLEGNVGQAGLSFIIRDHDRGKFEARKQRMRDIRDEIDRRYGAGTAELAIRDQYYNMAEKIAEHPIVVDMAREAIRGIGLEPVSCPVRGGTDGAQLSFRGLPCPNLGTGGWGFHGPYEHITAERMEQVTEVITGIIRMFAEDAP